MLHTAAISAPISLNCAVRERPLPPAPIMPVRMRSFAPDMRLWAAAAATRKLLRFMGSSLSAIYSSPMRPFFLLVLLAGPVAGQPVEQPAAQMVEGITRYLLRETERAIPHRAPSRERLRKILGVVDARMPFADLELAGNSAHPALLAETTRFQVYAVRWPVLAGVTAEGLWLKPRGKPLARIIAIPDAADAPEQFRSAQIFAASGCEVIVPVLIDRGHTWSGNPAVRMTTQPHREFIYRMAFEVGRHPLGYETQKVLAAVDWFSKQPEPLPIGVWGYGEGGALALFAGALDERITAAGVSGYFSPREGLWKQPLDRNVFGLLKDFGDAELAAMISPRVLVVAATPGPSWTAAGTGVTPGVLVPATREEIERELRHAGGLFKGSKLVMSDDGIGEFLQALGAKG